MIILDEKKINRSLIRTKRTANIRFFFQICKFFVKKFAYFIFLLYLCTRFRHSTPTCTPAKLAHPQTLLICNQGPPQISICGECEGNSALYGAKRHLIALFAARIRGPRQNLRSNVLVGKSGGTRRLYAAKRHPMRPRCRTRLAVVAQLVEHQLPKLRVTGSSPAYRSLY